MNGRKATVYSSIFIFSTFFLASLLLGVAWAFPVFTIINRIAKGIFFVPLLDCFKSFKYFPKTVLSVKAYD